MSSIPGKPRSEKPKRDGYFDGLRWLGVLPAAVLAGLIVHFVFDAVWQIVGSGGAGVPGGSDFAYAFRVFLFYVPQQLAFVIAGAATAPRHQRGTALVLTVLGILLSLVTHVVGQHLAGNRVGTTNYTHFIAETLGLLGGAAYVERAQRRRPRTPIC